MSKKFFLNDKISKGLSEAVGLAENYSSQYENKPLTTTRIIPDTTNPRQLLVQFTEIRDLSETLKGLDLTEEQHVEKVVDALIKGIAASDLNREKRIAEIESLKELALGIGKNGLLNPITTYKEGEGYIIIAGERRFLAHLLLGKKFVEARVFSTRPTGLEKKLAQWLENVQREDLSLYAKVENVRHISEAYQEAEKTEITPTILSKLSGVSRPSASRYLLLSNAPEDVLNALKENKLQSVLKAAVVASETDPVKRAALIEDASGNASVDWISQQKNNQSKAPAKSKGRASTQVQFGTTKKPDVAKKVILAVIEQYKLDHLKKKAANVNWQSYKDITTLFSEVVKELEGNK